MANRDLRIDVMKAARNGDWAEIKRLRDEGMNIDEVTEWEYPFDNSVLSEAAKHGHMECVEKLVEMGIGGNDEETMCKYRLALEMAAVKGHLECFRFLVENRLFKAVDDIQKYQVFIDASRSRDFDQIQKLLMENIDSGILNGWKGNNLMSLFVVYGCPPSCLQLLIDQGVDVNGVDYNGFTPLMCAVLTENVNCVRFLLGRGVNVNQGTVNDTTLFVEDGAIRNHQSTTALTGRLDERRCRGTTALMYAAFTTNNESLCEILQYCSDNGVNVSFLNVGNWAALDYAVFFGHRDSVSLLIESGADINGHYGACYKHMFAMKHHLPDILELTLEADRDPSSSLCRHAEFFVTGDVRCLDILVKCIKKRSEKWQSDLNTFLAYSAMFGHLDLVHWLLDQGLDVNYRDYSGATVLMNCCFPNTLQEDVLDLFIESGADVHIADNSGWTAIMHAARKGSVKPLEKLISHGASVHVRDCQGQTPLMLACAAGRSGEVVDLFVKNGSDVNAEDSSGRTAILFAAVNESEKCFQKLVSHGASVHVRDKEGQTALIAASSIGRDKTVEILLTHGVDINAQDGDGMTAMMHAVCHYGDKCLKLLLAEGADVDVSDKNGNTVLSFAMSVCDECLDLLLQCGTLLCNGVLKPVHRNAMRVRNELDTLSVRCVRLSMDRGIFEWDWCCSPQCLHQVVYTAVLHGISPGKFNFNGAQITPFQLAVIKSDFLLLMYLLANRYLFPEDLRVLYTNTQWQDGQDKISPLLEKFNAEPLRLQTLSFLTISKAISLAGSPLDRTRLVGAIPLPEKWKKVLQFQSDINISELCCKYWSEIKIGNVFDHLNFRQEMTFDRNAKLIEC